MGQNDQKIKELLKNIEAKKAKLGVKPKAAWKTNGILKFESGAHVNINTVLTLDKCVEAVAVLLKEKAFVKEAAELLEVEYVDVSNADYIDDFKLRAKMIVWDGEKRKLDALEQKLKDLRSEDAKTEDALSDIAADLA